MDNILGASLFRYWSERKDADGDPLFWPGGPGGYPYRGEPRTFSKDEFENLQLSYKFRNKTFDFSEPADMEEYRGVCEKISNNYYQLRDRDKVKDPITGEVLKIYLEWLEPAYTAPPSNPLSLPTEGQTHAITGPDAPERSFLTSADPSLLGRLAGVPPGMQFEPLRR